MTDADVDGSHIRALLLTLFNNKPFNKLIENGNIYLAQPPLFKINKGSKSIYIKDEPDLEKYIISNSKELKRLNKKNKMYQNILSEEKSKISIQRFKGLGEMNPSQLRETVMDPKTRRLVQLTITSTDNVNSMMDLLLSKKNAGARKEWLEKRGKIVTV